MKTNRVCLRLAVTFSTVTDHLRRLSRVLGKSMQMEIGIDMVLSNQPPAQAYLQFARLLLLTISQKIMLSMFRLPRNECPMVRSSRHLCVPIRSPLQIPVRRKVSRRVPMHHHNHLRLDHKSDEVGHQRTSQQLRQINPKFGMHQ